MIAAGHSVAWFGARREQRPDLVVTWGLGNPATLDQMRRLNARGVNVVGFDIGYWQRGRPSRKFRFSVNAAHPQATVMALDAPARPGTPPLRSDWSPEGRVVIVGMGYKSADTYGEARGEWERKTLKRVLEIYPAERIVFKPRPVGGIPSLPDIRTDTRHVTEVLRGAAVAICRHSNVAVDAIVAGVPAVADDGAAAAICPHVLTEGLKPLDTALRSRFLANLSWYQWTSEELRSAATWRAILERVEVAR